jgi:hypothetical protein
VSNLHVWSVAVVAAVAVVWATLQPMLHIFLSLILEHIA